MATSRLSDMRFDIGRVLNSSFSAIATNWIVVLGFTVLVLAVPVVANTLQVQAMITPASATDPSRMLAIFATPTYWILMAAGTLANSFAQAGLMSGLLKAPPSGRITFGDMLAGALRNILPLVVLTVLWVLALMVGWVLFIVPSLVMVTMWSVSAPALIAERRGIIGAFGRSRALTKGIRWPVFGSLVLFLIFYVVVAFALQGFASPGAFGLYQWSAPVVIARTLAASTIMTIALSSFLVALYREIIAVKEGGGTPGLAEIFA